jgi:hypothetical protein
MSNVGSGSGSEKSDVVGTITKWISIPSALVALGAAVMAWPLDREIKQLQASSARLEIDIKRTDAELRTIESSRKLTLEIYQEVQKVLRTEKKNSREEEAVRVLVQALAEDPMRSKLLDAIALGANSPDVRKKAETSAAFYRDELPTYGASPNSSAAVQTIGSSPSRYGSFNIDFFYCESSRQKYEPLALKAVSLKDSTSTGRWRVRLLPESVNAQAGYNIHENVIRYNSDEKGIAQTLLADLRTKLQVEATAMEIAYPTPNYVSVFFCAQ